MNSEELQKLKAGNRQLFSSLVRDHHHALIALAIPIVGHSEAEEVVQNAWVRAYKAIANFDGRSQPRTWLSRIVINEANTQLRSRKRERLFADMDEAAEHGSVPGDRFADNGRWRQPPSHWHAESPEALLMSAHLERCLKHLLAALPAKQRALLEMRDSGGLPFNEICNILSISASNARVLLHRARTQLFQLVDHYQETGEC